MAKYGTFKYGSGVKYGAHVGPAVGKSLDSGTGKALARPLDSSGRIVVAAPQAGAAVISAPNQATSRRIRRL